MCRGGIYERIHTNLKLQTSAITYYLAIAIAQTFPKYDYNGSHLERKVRGEVVVHQSLIRPSKQFHVSERSDSRQSSQRLAEMGVYWGP